MELTDELFRILVSTLWCINLDTKTVMQIVKNSIVFVAERFKNQSYLLFVILNLKQLRKSGTLPLQ